MSLRWDDEVEREARRIGLGVLVNGEALPDTITIDLTRKSDVIKALLLAWVRTDLRPTAAFASQAFWREVEDLERSSNVETCAWIVQPTHGPARRCQGKDKWGGARGTDYDLGVPLCRDHGKQVLRRATEYLAVHDADIVARAIEASARNPWASREVRQLIDREITRRMEERWAA